MKTGYVAEQRFYVVAALAGGFLGAVLTVVPTASGRPNIRDAFFAVYPNAVGTVLDTVPSRPGHCGVCHYDFSGGGLKNPYGEALAAALPNYQNNPAGRRQAVRSIENQDSDSDGFTTLTEVTNTSTFINTPTFPGLTPANVGNVTNVVVSQIQGHLVPSTGGDTTPPTVTVLAPNGGETLTANAPTTVQWTATDPSGVAAIDIFLSDDGGATWRPVALAISNSGTYTLFPPNRPTGQALVRVEALDNAFNRGGDQSDAAFTIVSPAGGRVPTTLRDFDQPGTQPLEAGTLSHPTACIACHGNYAPAVEPYRTWLGSMMSQASRDPLFEACLAVANQDAPDSGDLCLRCHIPRGWLRGLSVPTSGAAMQDIDKHGVSCDLCHRLVDPFYDPGHSPVEDAAILANLSSPPSSIGNGMYVVDPVGTRRGPFADATSGHAILVSPFHREAALCGTCHDVSNPAFQRDAAGNYVPNAFDAEADNFGAHHLLPIERTYSEWFYSAYNTPEGVYAPQFGGNRPYVATCQDCHMRAVTGKGCNLPEAPTRTDLPLHDMTGGSTWLPGVIGALYPNLPDEVNPAALQSGADRARYMLQNAATLAATQTGRTLRVTVTNQTGHKLPTGYPEGRRIWLNVRFYDAGGQLIGESGAYDAATGTLVQDPEARVYECKPGLDELTAPLVGTTPGPSFHFVLNNRIFKDNRIPPRGFTNAAYDTFGGRPVGHTYADGQYWDEAQYRVPASAVSAEVKLYYQSTSREYVEFLRDENTTNSAGQTLYDLWVANGRCPPELMATTQLALAPPVPGDIDGDGDVDGDDGAALMACLNGPEVAAPSGCAEADLDGDGDVDLTDCGVQQRLLTGE